MRKAHYVIVTAILLLFLCRAYGQEFNTRWIYAPQSDSLSHVWFRKAWLTDGRPEQATVTVTTTGFFKLYVNACNVGTALFHPKRAFNDTTAVAVSFDVTPYLRQDTNVVAVLYSPFFPSFQRKQIAVNIYGRDATGKAFSHQSDGSWLCRRANTGLTLDGGEWQDRRAHYAGWKEATLTDLALWRNAEVCHDDKPVDIKYSRPDDGVFIRRTETAYDLPVRLPFRINLAKPLWGFVRANIREARRGERLQIGRLQYTCSGETDEQAMPQFRLWPFTTIEISGDKYFKPSQINSLDIVEAR